MTHDETPYAPPTSALDTGVDPALAALPIDGSFAPEKRVLFLAAFLAMLAAWFAYDGWLNPDPDMLQHVSFNRLGAGVLLLAIAPVLYLSVRVRRTVASRRSGGSALLFLSPERDSVRVATAPWLWSLFFAGLNIMPHYRVGIGLAWFVGSQLSFGLAVLPLAVFANRLIGSGYAARGWTRL